MKILVTLLLLALLLVGGGNLWATYAEVGNLRTQLHQQAITQQQKQRAASEAVIAKICASFATIAALKPPPLGNSSTNPSRLYERQLHAALSSIGADLQCPDK